MIRNIQMKYSSLCLFVCMLLMALLTSCDGEKDLKIIDGNLPIKTSTLYMVGDATPNGWSIDAPTPFTQSEEDGLIFTWEGTLNAGEMKLCLTTGSWDAGFIRPENNGAAISKSTITNQTFVMWAGDPDNKWKVTEAGKYRLTFDLRNWTMSTEYLGEKDKPAVEPIVLDHLYAIGSATPGGWDWGNAPELEKKSDYIYVYEGELLAGELKFAGEKSWDVPFVRPASDGVKINKDGVESGDFVYAASPDDKWVVEDHGNYRLTFDLEHWTIQAEFLNAIEDAPEYYMIGEATTGGWSWDDCQVLAQDANNKKVFTWEGKLKEGTFKMSNKKDFNAAFVRPSSADVEVNANGVAANDFVVSAGAPDNQWKVTEEGYYRISINVETKNINVTYLGKVAHIYMIGDATPGGWSLDDAQEFKQNASNKDVFTWEGSLKLGTFKMSDVKDFGASFFRPSSNNVIVNSNGVSASDVIYTKDPDDQWKVTEAGTYQITLNLKNKTIQVVKK